MAISPPQSLIFWDLIKCRQKAFFFPKRADINAYKAEGSFLKITACVNVGHKM